MTSWHEFAVAEPELATTVRARLDAYRHKTVATLRQDGAPRISGVEATFARGELWLGMMKGSRKARDLQRDPRLALHSGTGEMPDDPGAWEGDAKISGRAEEITDPEQLGVVMYELTGGQPPPGASQLFRVNVTEVVRTRVGDPPDHLLIELWQEQHGLRRMRTS